MKFRNFIIVLLAVLMAFAFVSCKHEPKVDPKQTPKHVDYYQIEVTEGVDKDYYNRDKIKIEWEEPVKAGDTITLKYRSERAVYQWDIRDGSSLKWVYEDDKNGFVDPVLGDDGWYTLTYTFGNDITGKAVPSNSRFGVYFRGNFVTTDIFEIKDILLNDEELEIEASNIKSYAQLNDPAEDFDWSVKNYAVLFATGKPGKVDKTPIAEKVVAGGKVTGAPISKEGYTLTIFTDEAHSAVFDPDLPINEEKIFYYEYVGLPQTVTFVTGTEATIDPVKVPYGDTLTAAHTYDEKGNYAIDEEGSKIIVNLLPENPEKEGFAFAAWCSDEGATADFDLSTQIKSPITLYAKYGTPRTVTFDAQNGELEHATAIVADGYPVAMPEAPENGTYLFTGWYTDSECTTAYNFSAAVEADITLYAGWVEAVDVTLNLNYEGAPEATVYKAPYGAAIAKNNENLVPAARELYVFGGWYTDAGCTTAYDYETIATTPFTLYAKWTEAPLYQLVSTIDTVKSGAPNSNDKFSIYYKGDAENPEVTVNTGDVLSFRYRSTVAFTQFNVRGPAKWVYEQNSSALTSHETKEDGWTYVTYEFPADIENAYWRFDFISKTICVGDILEIQDWRLNGEPLAIGDSNVATKSQVGEVVSPTHSIVEGGAYAWSKQTVTFNMGVADAIDPVEVAFGGKAEKPADPEKDGYVFAGWYADAEFATAFDFASTPITKATTVYAKLGAKKVLTFDSQEGSAVAAINAAEDSPIAEPAEPTRLGYIFGGWYKEAGCENEFDFAAGIKEDTTVYAKWIAAKAITLNANGGTISTSVLYVESGKVLAEPAAQIGKVGYFFGGWYDDAECTVAHDFTAAVTADATLYAKWVAPTKAYQFTATVSHGRFQYRLRETIDTVLASIQPGDVFTMQVKFTTASVTPASYRIRTRSGEKNITADPQALPEPDGDGWYSITFTAPDNGGEYIGKGGLFIAFFASAEWAVNDVCLIKGLAYNGHELVLRTGEWADDSAVRDFGAYDAVKPNSVAIDL